MEQIAITATNLNDSHAKTLFCVFDSNGGSIGSAQTSSFCLSGEDIHDQHAIIGFEEGCFTIASVGDSEIFYNHSFSKLQPGYETTIELGDSFKIGGYELKVMEPKDLQDDFLDHKKVLDEVGRYDGLDHIEPKIHGRESLPVEHNLDEILSKEMIHQSFDTLPSISLKTPADTLTPPSQAAQAEPLEAQAPAQASSTPFTHHRTTQNLAYFIKQLQKQLETLPSHTLGSEIEGEGFEDMELEDMLWRGALLDSPLLINAMALTLICRELHSPLFEMMDKNPLESSLLYAIKQSHCGNQLPLQALINKALLSYIQKNKD